jgi:4-carboxymuconolactone decarboxylase
MTDDPYQQGLAIRREVLGDEHVDRALSGASGFSGPWQDYVTTAAWGQVWSRDGLDRRTRSMLTLALLAALSHDNELALHLRAAVGNGVTPDEIREVLLHTAVYAGVPAANSAFAVAARVLAEMGAEEALTPYSPDEPTLGRP